MIASDNFITSDVFRYIVVGKTFSLGHAAGVISGTWSSGLAVGCKADDLAL